MTKKVVVVGAGFGGLATVRGLRNVPVDVTLIDRHNYHLFQPLLYQVASGLLDPSQIAHPVRSTVRGVRNCNVRMTEVTSVDLSGRTVSTTLGPHAYDYLVIAAGNETNYFGNDSVELHSLPLKGLDDALRLRGRVLSALERASTCDSDAELRRLLTFVVVGGGPTGVEYAGALSELVRHVVPKDFPHLDVARARVILLEAGSGLLSTFAPASQRKARLALEHKGTQVLLESAVASADDHGVVLTNGERIDAETVVWSAGVKAASLTQHMGIATSANGQIEVDGYLSLSGYPEVYVIGDAAAAKSDGSRLPMLAPVAIQGGQYVAKRIEASLRSQEVAPFAYRDKGIMATVGRNVAVVEIGPLKLGGRLGWLTWLVVHLLYIVSFRSRLIVLINWGWNYLFYDRPIRLITDR